MPKRVYGYNEQGDYGSVIADALPPGWTSSPKDLSVDKPRRGRPPKAPADTDSSQPEDAKDDSSNAN